MKGGVAPWKNKACQRRGDNPNSKSYGGIVALTNVTLQLLKLLMSNVLKYNIKVSWG